MSNFLDEVVQEESIIDAIKKASIAIAKQPIRVGRRKLRSSFSLEAQQDISAMHGGEKDDFHGWLHDIKKMSQDDYYKLDEKTQHRLYKEYQLDSIYKEEDREKKWKPRGLFDDMLDGLQYEMQNKMDKEILNELMKKIPSNKK
ncbi:MAG: hypothetical protein ACI4OP_03190 [Candidatus Coprovivens sp.]